MKLKTGRDMIVRGRVYKANREGIVEVPDDVLASDGVKIDRASVVDEADTQPSDPDTGDYIEMNLDELEKDDLVDVAARLKIDSPSNLKRWGEEKLREEIRAAADAQTEGGATE